MHKEDILIIFPEGDYTNNDAYEAVLTYLSKKQYLSGYGINLPITRDSCIFDYYKTYNTSKYSNSRYLWHFYISFKDRQKDKFKLLMAANQIAAYFSPKYQVIYSFDNDTDNDHIHFAVNAYSYYYDAEPLSEKIMQFCIEQMKIILKNTYPYYSVNHKWK